MRPLPAKEIIGVFLLIINCAFKAYSSSLSENPVNQNQTPCGHIDVNGSIKVQIYKGKTIPNSIFEQIHKNLSGASIKVDLTNCYIEICGHPTILRKGRVIVPKCTSINESISQLSVSMGYGLDYEATSIQCGCPKAPCDSKSCDNVRDINDDTCAVLYQRLDCNDCSFDAVKLSQNETFKTETAAVIRSAFVKPNCTLIETGFGYSSYDQVRDLQEFVPFNVSYKTTTPLIYPSQTRLGEVFSCSCPNLDNNESINASKKYLKNPNEQEIQVKFKLSEPWIAVIASAGLFVLILISAFFALLAKRRHKFNSKPVVSLDEYINKFKDESFDENSSPGVLQAYALPFDSLFEIPRNRLVFDHKDHSSVLGSGAFGVVYKGKLKPDNHKGKKTDVAIKTVKPYAENGYIKAIINEVKVLAYVGKHPNIMQFLGACITKAGEVYIVLELCTNGSLKKHLESIRETLFEGFRPSLLPCATNPDYFDSTPVEKRPPKLCQTKLNQFFAWCKEIATGMEWLAKKKVVHIDLSSRNILLDFNYNCKIGDFGLSRKLYDRLNYTKNTRELVPIKCGAVESITESKYSIKSDVWGYGVTLWEIFSVGEDPYRDQSYDAIVQFLKSGQRLPCPPYASPEIFKCTMSRCWDVDIEKRPTFTEMREYFERITKNYEYENLHKY